MVICIPNILKFGIDILKMGVLAIILTNVCCSFFLHVLRTKKMGSLISYLFEVLYLVVGIHVLLKFGTNQLHWSYLLLSLPRCVRFRIACFLLLVVVHAN